MVGEAVSVIVGGAGGVTTPCAAPDTELLAGVVDEFCAQPASAEIAAHTRTQCATRGTSPVIDPAWRLIDVIKDPLHWHWRYPQRSRGLRGD